MYEVIWATTAEVSYLNNLEYWNNRNKSNTYSLRIIDEVGKLNKELAKNPLFLSRYHVQLNLYQRLLMKQEFSVFYEVNKSDKRVLVKHFRSNRQRPLV